MCLSFGFIQVINYGLLLWLADYFNENTDLDYSGNIISIGYLGYTIGILVVSYYTD